jgi:hypothetical protein
MPAERKAELFSRQSGESPVAYSAFTLYRDLGPERRSLAEVTRRLRGQQEKDGGVRLVFLSDPGGGELYRTSK